MLDPDENLKINFLLRSSKTSVTLIRLKLMLINKKSSNYLYLHVYLPSRLGEETAKEPFSLRFKLPLAYLHTTLGGGFAMSSLMLNNKQKNCNTNFYYLWFEPTRNWTLVYRFSSRHCTQFSVIFWCHYILQSITESKLFRIIVIVTVSLKFFPKFFLNRIQDLILAVTVSLQIYRTVLER